MGEIISCINAQNEKKLTFGLCICERIINEQAIQLFASSILEDKALTILSFVHCEFTSYDCMKLLGNSIKLSGITSLNFSHTNLSQQSFQTMIESFSNNSIITELFLDSTNISNEYIPILCGLLKTTKTLRIIETDSQIDWGATDKKWIVSHLEEITTSENVSTILPFLL